MIENSDLRVVCYYTNWSLYREAMPTLYPDHIDPLLCTHIHYAFADINPLTLTITPTEEHDIHWTDRLGMVLNGEKEDKRRDLFVCVTLDFFIHFDYNRVIHCFLFKIDVQASALIK